MFTSQVEFYIQVIYRSWSYIRPKKLVVLSSYTVANLKIFNTTCMCPEQELLKIGCDVTLRYRLTSRSFRL